MANKEFEKRRDQQVSETIGNILASQDRGNFHSHTVYREGDSKYVKVKCLPERLEVIRRALPVKLDGYQVVVEKL